MFHCLLNIATVNTMQCPSRHCLVVFYIVQVVSIVFCVCTLFSVVFAVAVHLVHEILHVSLLFSPTAGSQGIGEVLL